MAPKLRTSKKAGKPDKTDTEFVEQISMRITRSTADKLDELEARVGPISTRAQISRVAFDRGLDVMLQEDYPAKSTGR